MRTCRAGTEWHRDGNATTSRNTTPPWKRSDVHRKGRAKEVIGAVTGDRHVEPEARAEQLDDGAQRS